MAVRAIVKTALPQMRAQVWHEARQVHGGQVVQAKRLKTRGINQGTFARVIEPIPTRVGGGVLARVEHTRNLLRGRLCLRHQRIDQGAFANPRRAQHQRRALCQTREQAVQFRGVHAQTQTQQGVAHGGIGREPTPSACKGFAQVALVQGEQGRDLCRLAGNQCARELHLGKLRLGREQNQHLVQIRGKRFAADLVLSVEQVASRRDGFHAAFVPADLPRHPIPHHHGVLFASGVT